MHLGIDQAETNAGAATSVVGNNSDRNAVERVEDIFLKQGHRIHTRQCRRRSIDIGQFIYLREHLERKQRK